jgi:hypothetical protein
MPLTLCLLSLWATPEASLKSLAIEYTPPRPISLDNLPVDVVLFIADYLSVKDLVRVAQVCFYFYFFASSTDTTP